METDDRGKVSRGEEEREEHTRGGDREREREWAVRERAREREKKMRAERQPTYLVSDNHHTSYRVPSFLLSNST